MTAHILVVDDDPVQRRLLKNAVERHGHTAHLAENGPDRYRVFEAEIAISST